MKITRLFLLASVFLFFCGNASAMDMPPSKGSTVHEHCGETNGDSKASTDKSSKESSASPHMTTRHEKDCKSKKCSMKTCCIAPALQASTALSLDVYFTMSTLPLTIEHSVLHGLREAIYHPPTSIS